MPAAAATSRARHARSATTRPIGTPAVNMASRIVPLPEARTATPLIGSPTAGIRCRYSSSRSAAKGGSEMKRQPTVAEIVMVAGGAVTFIFSFLHFVANVNAWSSDFFGLFPVTTLIAVLGLAMVVFVLLEWFAGFMLPEFLTFTYKQMYVT